MYRSRPSSPAITSADIVLPVPESPANSAATPIPRPPPGRIRHSLSTCSRCARGRRARCSCGRRRRRAAPGRTSRRPARPAGPAARSPARVLRPGTAPAAGRRSTARSPQGAAAAAPTGRPGRSAPGPRCRWTAGPATGRPVAEGGRPQPLAFGGGQPGRLAVQRDLRLQPGSQLTSPVEQHRHRQSTPAGSSTSGADVASASTGSATTPAPRSSASRPATPRPARPVAGRVASRARSTPTDAAGPPAQRRRGDRRAGAPARGRAGRPGRRSSRQRAPDQSPHGIPSRPAACGGSTEHDARQRRVRVVVAEQVRDDPVGHPQPARQERALRVLDGTSRSARPAAPRGAAGRAASGEATETPPIASASADRGAAPGDVVVEVAVEPLEARVQLRDEGTASRISTSRSVSPQVARPARRSRPGIGGRRRARRLGAGPRCHGAHGVVARRHRGAVRASSRSTVSSVR